MKKEEIFSVHISTGSYPQFIDEILNLTEGNHATYVCFANVHMVVEAYQDKAFRSIVNGADLVAPDGKPLSLFLTHLKKIKQERVCGMDLLPDLLREASHRHKSVFFYGTTPEILESIAQRIKLELPLLTVAGYYSPPFRDLTPSEKTEIIDRINAVHPDLLLVSLGCPKQEKWMAEHKEKIKSCMLGLGQAFHVYAGKEKRLPKWMRNLSLEWAYRLYLEPRRLWKRYIYTNSIFLFLTLQYIFQRMFRYPKKLSPSKCPP